METLITFGAALGLAAALGGWTYARSRAPRAYLARDGVQEARLIALAHSAAPEGHGSCSPGLLADKLVELQIVESISDETVRRTLKRGT